MYRILITLIVCFFLAACAGGEVVRVTTARGEDFARLPDDERARIARIREAQRTRDLSPQLNHVIRKVPHVSAEGYLQKYHEEDYDAETTDYKVGGCDVLGIIVYEEPDLSLEAVRVSADGTITFPLIGRVKVGGRTAAQIEDLIADRLAEEQYLVNPHVSVLVKEYLSKKVLVLGPVDKPGSYELRGGERLLDVISRAGGVDPEEGGSKISILRTLESGGKIAIDINLGRLMDGEDSLSNVRVCDQDVVYIPRAEKVFILGQVKEPGDYSITGRDVTLVEAVGMAGGFTRIAARNRTKIIRLEDSVEKVFHVKVDEITGGGRKGQDIVLKPNDIIVVPESFF